MIIITGMVSASELRKFCLGSRDCYQVSSPDMHHVESGDIHMPLTQQG